MPKPIRSIETGSGVAETTAGGGSDEKVSLAAALKAARYPKPLSTKDGTTDESASEKASVIGLVNVTKAELNITAPVGGVEAERLAPVPPLLPVRVALAAEVIVPESKFVWPLTGVFRRIENVPVKPPSEIVPFVTESGVLDARFNVSVAESGPVSPGGSVPVTLEKMK